MQVNLPYMNIGTFEYQKFNKIVEQQIWSEATMQYNFVLIFFC